MSRPSYRTCDHVTARCTVEATTYGYYPILSVNCFFTALFGVALLTQLAIGFRSKTWTYTIALGIGTLLECLGYVGRVLMNKNPWNSSAFQLQICAIVLGPSFIAAAIYLTLKHLVSYCGPEYSVLKPRLYPWVFVGCDFGSIVLQAIGGGVAAGAGSRADPNLLHVGNGLIVAGIAFQVATMAVCGLLVAVYFYRFQRDKKQRRQHLKSEDPTTEYERNKQDTKSRRSLKAFCASIGLAYVTVLIRCIYRLPEMAGGWGNPLMREETDFLVLDGMMVGIAVCCLTLVHPGIFFAPMRFRSRQAVR